MAKVAIIMGSASDKPTMEKVGKMLEKLQIPYTTHIFSAHRTPNELSQFIRYSINDDNSYKVVIAGAGMSAALAGVIASETQKPVIGIPLSGGKFHGTEAMLSTLEMPPGIPVLTVGIDATKNAALAAARIIALSDSYILENLKDFQENQKQAVLLANQSLAVENVKTSCPPSRIIRHNDREKFLSLMSDADKLQVDDAEKKSQDFELPNNIT